MTNPANHPPHQIARRLVEKHGRIGTLGLVRQWLDTLEKNQNEAMLPAGRNATLEIAATVLILRSTVS